MIPLEWMPPLMLRGLVLFMLVGFPVAFSLSALGVALGFFAIEQGFFHFSFLQAIPSRIFGNVLANELLLAIPFFTFMGAVPEKCGLAEDMLDSMGQLFGPAKGGPRLFIDHRRLRAVAGRSQLDPHRGAGGRSGHRTVRSIWPGERRRAGQGLAGASGWRGAEVARDVHALQGRGKRVPAARPCSARAMLSAMSARCNGLCNTATAPAASARSSNCAPL